ncbi:DUF885 domain-containing protein [Occallatibacter riparius]|uniref:DUF885 domain-containing protein n=1 Tax=Occallatibacter riparius TaxID=1002689 RepID=A0A9J7BSU8_9BACT|nr:DUF885 domain-containing protein [Occallatibacter riparius]UWZ84093.1 DUF885 domain-containing protein [Occallatibacter riparius]
MRLIHLSSAAAVAALLLSSFAAAQKLTPAAPNDNASVADRRAAMNALFQQYWTANLERSPEFASALGDKRWNDKISDYSVTAINAWLEQEQNFLTKLGAIDDAGFTDAEKTSRELLLRDFADDIEAADFKEWEMPVDQMHGIYETYPGLANHLSFNEVKDYDDWIARLNAIPTAFAQVTENMSIGIEDHRVPPKYLLKQTLDQVKELANQKPEDSPLASPLKKFPASIAAKEQQRIRTETLNAISKRVLPAYQRFARFLEVSYIPAGRDEPGISSIPDGAKYYQFLIHRETTLNLTANQIHQIGLNEVKRDETEMLAIAQKLGFKDLASFRASLKDNPKLKPASPQALLDTYQGHVNDMQAKLPELFGRLPKNKLEVVRMPEYLEKTAPPAYYDPGSPTANRPGHLWVNFYNVPSRSLLNVEAISYHEGLPGHHLQFAIAQEQEGVPEFRKHDEYTAFVEGWALYSERVGKDIGFYQDPYSDFGRLDADMWRAIRLVVDTGVHSQHWTRQEMVDYFHAHSSLDEPTVQSEVDRYIAWPGQALAYKIGQMTILELRDKAKAELGSKFDIRAFHDQVVDSGAMPMDMLVTKIEAWIATQK